MSESSWVLKGVDPAVREKAVEEAARLGVSVADYLTDMVVRSALLDQMASAAEVEAAPVEASDATIFAPPPGSSEGFAVRHRLKALERRLGAAVGSLDGSIHALDAALFDITARVGDVEALAGDAAYALGQTQQEVNNAVASLQLHLAVVEDNLAAQDDAQEARSAGLGQRIEDVAAVARGAERSAAVLADAHEALKHAVADDFAAFTHETADQLNASLAQLRAAADAAAEHADAAAAHLMSELRALRVSIDEQLADSAAETRSRMHAAFADAAERMAALAERITDAERLTARTGEQLRAQIADAEDGAQTALEETALTLRRADAALAADLTRTAQEQHAALEMTRADLAAQLTAVREGQVAQLARLKLVDGAVGNAINGLNDLRERVERSAEDAQAGVRAALDQAHADWQERFGALAARTAGAEQQTEALRTHVTAEVDRVEACAFAALEKLRRDLAAGDADGVQQLQLAVQDFRDEIASLRDEIGAETNLQREEHTGTLARITLLDNAITRLESASGAAGARLADVEGALAAIDPELEQRVTQLEHAAAKAETEQALSVIRTELAALTQRLEQRDTQANAFEDQLQGVARMLNRVAAQTVEANQRGEERAHQVDVALADLRLQTIAARESDDAASAIEALQQRLAGFEQKQASTLDALRAEMAGFVSDNDRRLAALESRPAAAEQSDLAAEFEALRGRIEERVLGVELRSVRTLEQVVDTVAMLEQRLTATDANQADEAKTA